MPNASGIITTGRNSDIDTAAEILSSRDVPCIFGVLVLASTANAGRVCVGPKGVTYNTDDATDGIVLDAGDSVFIEIDNLNKVYVIASVVNQRCRYVAV